MMQGKHTGAMTRRQLLARIGMTAGGAMMYQAMSSLGMAAESTFTGPLQLDGDAKGASVLILGAGLAGMTAAFNRDCSGARALCQRRPSGRRISDRLA